MDSALRYLLDTTSTFEFEEQDGLILLESVSWHGPNIMVGLSVRQQNRTAEQWNLECQGVRDSKFKNGPVVGRISLESQHPLLLPHTFPISQLYFHGQPSNVDELIGELVEAHRGVVGYWFPWGRFLNLRVHQSPRQLLNEGFGQFAEGPQPLIEVYAHVFRKHALAPSSPGPRRPTWWDGNRWIGEERPLYALILGNSHIIATEIAATRL